ncbi:hypothetical protein AKJ45_00880 [candidate division MSBL1 archaeon SCGC-AAA261F19]|uniref:Coenzyme A biosynthesis bifunctional protein CoaBC n=1 Tax=candidate division MSBL1 archaeon SCGC-AAA261F19 TaxID=1698275 RepID=A0A133VB29_9EURY|nr:hypothetical protein AKJ45_00880 [candidate division MSBL1 archaeon SCGC-AAA261F19]
MHPSRDIKGSESSTLKNQNIVLGITGSVAAFKCVGLVRKLMRCGAEVRVVMSEMATRFITPELMHWASSNSVVTKLTGATEHVELAQWGNLMIIAPSTANTISKIAQAIDDTTVTSVASVAQGLQKPILIVPAMHGSMYSHQILQQNISRLKEAGVHFLEPRMEEGVAKFRKINDIVSHVGSLVHVKDMKGKRVLVTAGPTIERIDALKILTNRSSGKMGVAVARAASLRGADVVLIYGPGTEPEPFGVKTIRVETTLDMRNALVKELENDYDLIVGTAAPQDLTVESPPDKKLRHSKPVDLRLTPAPRVLDDVRELAPNAFLVGFKAECNVSNEELLDAAKSKIHDNQMDMVVANDVMRPNAGFGSETNDVLIVWDSEYERMKASKAKISDRILDLFVKNI